MSAELYQMKLLAQHTLSVIKDPYGFGVYASAGENYRYAIFGRDSIEFAEDIIDIDSKLVKEILIARATLQGVEKNDNNEEEPGKIHHEYRSAVMGGVEVPEKSKKTIATLSARWGGTVDTFRYYGSIDSTPLFVRLVGRYVSKFGPDILSVEVIDSNGNSRPFISHVCDAGRWVKDKVEASPWSLLEFKRANPDGLSYQAWKDSDTGYLHLDGTAAVADRGIASIEVQGYAYDALMAMVNLKILSNSESKEYLLTAQKLQKSTLDNMWVHDTDAPYFAIGLDRDENDKMRQINTCTSSGAAVLDSNILLDLSDSERKKYVEPIVKMIMGDNFITDVGVRTRSLIHKNLISTADYHGSLVSWPKETFDIAKGLRRHGFVDQAIEIEDRLLVAAQKSNEFYEFYYVDESGDVVYDYEASGPNHDYLAGGASIPEKGQAWTVSALLNIINRKISTMNETNTEERQQKIFIVGMGTGEISHAVAFARYAIKQQAIVYLAVLSKDYMPLIDLNLENLIPLVLEASYESLNKTIVQYNPDVLILCNSKILNSDGQYALNPPNPKPLTLSIDSNWLFNSNIAFPYLPWVDEYCINIPEEVFNLGLKKYDGYYEISDEVMKKIKIVGLIPSYEKIPKSKIIQIREKYGVSSDEKLMFLYTSPNSSSRTQNIIFKKAIESVIALREKGYKIKIISINVGEIIKDILNVTDEWFINLGTVNAHDFYDILSSSDLVFQHQGFGTLEQAIAACVPVITNVMDLSDEVTPGHAHAWEVLPFKRYGACSMFYFSDSTSDATDEVERLLYNDDRINIMKQQQQKLHSSGESGVMQEIKRLKGK